MLRSCVVRATVVLALLAIHLSFVGGRALAIQHSEDKVWFRPVGVGVGQVARVNVDITGTAGTGDIAAPDTRWDSR